MMDGKRYISVIIPLKLEWEPCYSVPEKIQEISVGDRIKVRFANKEYYGVVSGMGIEPETDLKKIKPISSVETGFGRILPEEIALWRAVADYYLCSVGEVYKAAYPYGKVNLEEARAVSRQKVEARRERLAGSIRSRIERIESRIEKKKDQIAKAIKETARLAYSKELEKAMEELERAQKALADILESRHPSYAVEDPTDTKVYLTEAQEIAYLDIKNGFKEGKPVLLHGVTGAGKTEIYVKLALECLESGRNVLYMVPEIALSRQLEDRLTEHFGNRLMVFHSGETAASRRDTAEAVREASSQGRRYIVLGTRSSLFLPHNDLGLIIVDEEHDSSYKQDSPAPRYNGRDTALMLHKIHRCDIILGSATPSLEEAYNCRAGRHRMVGLKERYHGGDDSEIEIIDTKAERKKNGMKGNFSRKLISEIEKTLKSGEQVIILRSRKAWASAMQCDYCGEIVKCPHCNVSLSRHKDGRTVCHYCGYTTPYTGICSRCHGPLTSIGAGTQRIEEEAAELFPGARIARLDGDTSRNKGYETKTIRDFGNGTIDILIGTQMVTKGFDFGRLGLVAVVAADSLLGLQDFRADEKALQLLEQFRGRCGRRGRKGMFIIQTSQPEHPVYQKIASNEPAILNSILLQERKDFHFPPFSRIVEISIRDTGEGRAASMAEALVSEIRKLFTQDGYEPVTGPYSPAVDKVADQYIRCIRINLKKDRNLASGKEALKRAVHKFEKDRRYEGHITINVDPQ